ncbi:MAG: hypothetical protein KA792_08945 [Bacteroidales bacterium]|nr:hypothetical protein [Bacteroidales bacterium]
MGKNLFILLFCLCIATYTIAQIKDNETTIQSKHFIGLGAGMTTGLGLSYRYLPSRFGLQVNFIPVIRENNNYVSVGFSGLLKLRQNKKTNLLLYLGNHYLYNESKDSGPINNESKNLWNIGLGPCFEFNIRDVLTLNLMFGYGLYDITNKPETNFAFESALYYKL